MARSMLIILTGAAMLALASPGLARPGADAAIRQLEAQQAAAWNAHDAAAYAALFEEDADVVNVLGWWWKSRAELERKLGGAFASVFARSALSIEAVEIRPLPGDMALAHVTWSMTGAMSPDGSGRTFRSTAFRYSCCARREAAG